MAWGWVSTGEKGEATKEYSATYKLFLFMNTCLKWKHDVKATTKDRQKD